MIILLNILFKSSFYIHELSYLQEYILKYRNFILTFLWYSRLHLCLCFSSNYPCCSFVCRRGMFIVLLEYNLGQGEGTDVHMARRLWRTWTTGVWSRLADRPPADPVRLWNVWKHMDKEQFCVLILNSLLLPYSLSLLSLHLLIMSPGKTVFLHI